MQDWIQSLQNASAYDHPVRSIELRETHISWVFLTGDLVYKVKKPVDFGFLDFTTLEKRKFYCEEELRLNLRLAPEIYLRVVAIVQTSKGIRVLSDVKAADEDIVDYAVCMKQFQPDLTLDRIESENGLSGAQVDSIADLVAGFHKRIAIAPSDSIYGTPDQIIEAPRANFTDIHLSEIESRLSALLDWTNERWSSLKPLFGERKTSAFIRECHGDMHLGNIALVNNAPLIFDCIEFNESFRWIDVQSDAAFLVMDLVERGHRDHAFRFLNRYLEITGDYEGTKVLPFYLVYRAMVRAKVASLRLTQAGPHNTELQKKLLHYVQLAEGFAHSAPPFLILTCGLSGSGKTRVTRDLFSSGIIRVRSDVERKRIFSMKPEEKSKSLLNQGLYTQEAGDTTYNRLLHLVKTILQSGFPAVADATFLEESRRTPFIELAQSLQIPVAIAHCTAPPEVLRERVAQRIAKGRDASEADLAVLDSQLARGHKFTALEEKCLVTINTNDERQRQSAIERLLQISEKFRPLSSFQSE